VTLDFDKLHRNADAHAGNVFECRITLEEDAGDPCVKTFIMWDEEGVETSRVDVTDAGTFNGRQMICVIEPDGEFLVEAFGDVLARLMWC